MARILRSKLIEKNIIKTDKNTKHLPVSDLKVGSTYQTHARDIIKIMSIDLETNYITLRNISQVCNQRIEFKNIRIVKQF